MLGWVRSRAACACVARGSTAPYAARGRHTAYRPSGVAGASHTTVQGHGSTNGTAQTQPGAWARMVHMQNVPPLASLRAGGAVPASLGQSGAVWDAASVSDPSSVDFPHGTRGKPAGVAFEAHRNKWRAYIKLKNKSVHLGTFDNGTDALAARLRAEELATQGVSPDRIHAELGAPNVLEQTAGAPPGVHRVLVDEEFCWFAVAEHGGIRYELGTFATKEAAVEAYEKQVEEIQAADSLLTPDDDGMVIEEVVNPDEAEFPHGNLHRPLGVRLHHGKWQAYITVDQEFIHLGTFTNGSDAARLRTRAEELQALGASASKMREILDLPDRQVTRRRRPRWSRGYYQTKGGRWVARVTRHHKSYTLGQFDSEQDAKAAYQEAVAKFQETDRRRESQKVSRFLHGDSDAAVVGSVDGEPTLSKTSPSPRAVASVTRAASPPAEERHATGAVIDDVAAALYEAEKGVAAKKHVGEPRFARDLWEAHGGPEGACTVDFTQHEFPLGTINRPRGVRFIKLTGRWSASITVDKTCVTLGTFNDGNLAAAVRKRAEELVARGATPTELRAALDLPTARAQPRVQAAPKFPFLADKDLFLSRIQYAGVDYHLGFYRTEDEARQAYTYKLASLEAEAAVRRAQERLASLGPPPKPVSSVVQQQPTWDTASVPSVPGATKSPSDHSHVAASPLRTSAATTPAGAAAAKSGATAPSARRSRASTRAPVVAADVDDAETLQQAATEDAEPDANAHSSDAFNADVSSPAHVASTLADDSHGARADTHAAAGSQSWGFEAAFQQGSPDDMAGAGGGSDDDGEDDDDDFLRLLDDALTEDDNYSALSEDDGSDSGSESDSDALPDAMTNMPPRQQLVEVNTTPNHRLQKQKVPREQVAGFVGVWKRPPKGGEDMVYEALLLVHGTRVSGGVYETPEEAAYAYDALARMYEGPSAATNFTEKSYKQWIPPSVDEASLDAIPVRKGQLLTVDEVVGALTSMSGIDVTVIDLEGKSDLASYMVFVTGRSVPHMRKMADTIVKALRVRGITPNGNDAAVEGRECDDWMVVDATNIIVNVFDEEARECYDLESFIGGLREGEDPYEGLSYDEWLERNPIPEKWLKRLERDELED